MKLTDREWSLFSLKNIFINYHGKRLTKNNRIVGKIPLLTACETNQGISSYICEMKDMQKFENFISIDMFGHAFYHNYSCYGDDNIYFFKNKDIASHAMLFIIACINKNSSKYSYGNQFRQNNADGDKFLLPINSLGQPDYQFMEDYIKEIMYRKRKLYLEYAQEKLQTLPPPPDNNLNPLQTKEWKEFFINDIFTFIRRGKRLIASDRITGNLSYYSASNTNNGLTDFISNPLFVIKKLAIIYSTFGDSYFSFPPFTASDEMTILSMAQLNKYNAQFIIQTLKQNKTKYSFGRKAFSHKILKDKILLPITEKAQPDYAYMEKYIKNIFAKKYNEYVRYAQAKL